MQDPPRHVVVTGAGLTCASVADAPLLVRSCDNDILVQGPRIGQGEPFLQSRRNRRPAGLIDVGRLMFATDDPHAPAAGP